MFNTYRKHSFTIPPRIVFDPANYQHMLDYAGFLKYNNWRNGCKFLLEDPYEDIPTMIRTKIVDYRIKQFIDQV